MPVHAHGTGPASWSNIPVLCTLYSSSMRQKINDGYSNKRLRRHSTRCKIVKKQKSGL
jgi:hypothetical protein